MTTTATQTSTSAFAQDSRPLVAMDWSARAVHVTFDGKTVTRFADIHALLSQLTTPHRIAAESTLESWSPDRRLAAVDAARAAGHEIYVFRPIHTARNRPEEMKKTDENDARVIFELASGGRLHLYPLPTIEPDWVERRQELNHRYLHLRASGLKPALVRTAVAVIGPYKDLDTDAQLALGNGSTYSESLLAAVCFAASHARNRPEFERLLGLHGSAYPSLLRSDVHHHSFRHARNRGVAWPMFRSQLRRLYQQLKYLPEQ